MSNVFRESKFLDFNTGAVMKPPLVLAGELSRPWGLREKIELFECRVEVWQLGVAVRMLRNMEAPGRIDIWSHAAYALISVVFSYFEMIGKTLNPASAARSTAWEDFNYGFSDVYPQYRPPGGNYSDANVPDVKEFRNRIRNGMYHLAYTKRGLWIHHDDAISIRDFEVRRASDVGMTGSQLVYLMDPHRVTRTVVNHFPGFVGRLRNPDSKCDSMRSKFGQFFDQFHEP